MIAQAWNYALTIYAAATGNMPWGVNMPTAAIRINLQSGQSPPLKGLEQWKEMEV